ncbi:CrcB family protein [Halobaculum sp. MBLA0147]|uniref:fluoride efflux transporter FluC n=1 Tax=Halobaculum sp. MBLA0147 TaxID=3079934 RepID=UPI0035245C6A
MDDSLVGLGLVALGGALGAATRYAVALVVATPGGTLVANVAGSLLLGVLAARRLPDRLQSFAATGFCSSFTTYSTFTVETLSLSAPAAVGYVLATYALGLAGAMVGVTLGRRA